MRRRALLDELFEGRSETSWSRPLRSLTRMPSRVSQFQFREASLAGT